MLMGCGYGALASPTPLAQAVANEPMGIPAPRNLQFTRITQREGLSQAGVNAIVQDQYGTIWLGTQEGLNRYDGYEMVVYEHLPGEADTLSHDWVWSVHLDKEGTLWVGTDGGGLNRYNRGDDNFTHFRHDPDNPGSLSSDRVRVIFQDAQATFWIGTDGGGLNRFDPETGEFTRFRHVESQADSLPGDTVLAIFEDCKGKLWVGTDNGLARMDHAREKFTNYRHDPSLLDSLSNNQVRSIYEDRGGQIWIGTYEVGLNVLDRSTNSFRHFQHDRPIPHSLSHNRVRDILRSTCRQSDTIIRWGGDEFMILGNTASPQTVEQLAERIRVSLAEYQYKLGNGHTGRLSGSIGFAMYPFAPSNPQSLTWEQTVAVADHAAYTAKHNGRNAWVGIYGNKKTTWEELSRTNINLPALARQKVVHIRSSLERIEEYTEKTAQARA